MRSRALALFFISLVLVVGVAGCRAQSKETPAETPVKMDWSRNDSIPRFLTDGWLTDFTRHSVSYGEILPADISRVDISRDGIPPIYQPKFETVDQADGWLDDSDSLLFLRIGGQVRAYPLQILIWHEIVNDEIAGIPVLVTYSPPVNTAAAFERRLAGEVYTFGVSGLLRHSGLVMWDHETESLWQQATGEAIAGELTGQKLAFFPASIVAWKEFSASFPDAEVLSRDTGYSRPYGENPYEGYDTSIRPELFNGIPDQRLAAFERVIGVNVAGESVAYPFSVLFRQGVVNDRLAGKKIAIFYLSGAASPLDKAYIEESRRVGSAAVFDAVINGRTLTFEKKNGQIVDRETGSTWDIFGTSVAGELQGQSLEPVIHGTHFWFAWAAFNPETRIYGRE